MPANVRNLERNGLYINRWNTGEVSNRSPIFTPFSAMGLQMLSRQDAFLTGLNMEISPQMTAVRSYGFSRYCSAAFGSSDFPLGGFSFKNIAGTITPLVDCPTKVVKFTTSAQTTVFSKSVTTQGSFSKVGDYCYYVDGTDAKKFNAALTVSGIGITAPASAPSLSFGAGALSPLRGYVYVYVYRNSTTGHVSTASPVSANTGALTSQNITVHYTASSDAQVDKIWIFRTQDGGGQFYFLTEVANATSTFTDSTADSGLNTAIVAPVAHANDPIPSGAGLLVWHAGRLWVASGNNLYFSAGPDATLGNGAEAWPPANVFPCPGKITALRSTSSGLAVFTADNLYVVYGVDAASFTVPQLWQANFGVPDQNHVVQDGDLLFMYTSKAQCMQLTASGFEEIGSMIGKSLRTNFTPGSCYLALHRSGEDQGLWISNGSTKMRRYSFNTNSWDVERQVVGGAGAVFSIEATLANWVLFTGRTTGSGFILGRDTTTYQDDGQNFTCTATVGSLVVAPPGGTAPIDSVLLQVMPVGTYPTVGILANEISGTFTTLPNPVNDPPLLLPSSTITQKRHYLLAATTATPLDMCHCQIQISFIAENARAEILGLGLGNKV